MDTAIVFAGTPANAAETLQALVQQGFRVVLAVTRTDAPVGRNKIMTASPVAEMAQRLGIPVLKTNRPTESDLAAIAASGARLGVVVAYGCILSKTALETLEQGWFNLHYSLLPKWRGAAPVQRAIMAGDRETGVTLFKLDEGMDTGPIVGTVKTLIEPTETAGDLLRRLTALGCTLLSEVLPSVQSGLAIPTEQTGEASLASKISRNEARIDWSATARTIEHQIRGCNPEPGAWTMLDGQPFKIHEAIAIADPSASEAVGALVVQGDRVMVSTGAGLLLLKTVQPASKRAMSAGDWVRGVGQGLRFD